MELASEVLSKYFRFFKFGFSWINFSHIFSWFIICSYLYFINSASSVLIACSHTAWTLLSQEEHRKVINNKQTRISIYSIILGSDYDVYHKLMPWCKSMHGTLNPYCDISYIPSEALRYIPDTTDYWQLTGHHKQQWSKSDWNLNRTLYHKTPFGLL